MIYFIKFIYKKGNKAYRGAALFAIFLYICSISLTGDFAIHTLEDDYTHPSYANGDVIIISGRKVYEFTGDEVQICRNILINLGVKEYIGCIAARK